MTDQKIKKHSLLYFSPEPNIQGHASYTHTHEIIQNLELLGWTVSFYSPSYHQGKLPSAFKRIIGIFKSLIVALNHKNIEVIYMRWHFTSWPLAYFAKVRGIPIAIEINGPITDLFISWPITQRFKFFFSWLMFSQLKWASALIPVTDGLADMCKNHASDNAVIKVIPNGANIHLFSPNAKDVNIKKIVSLPGNYCVFFGTMAPWQGINNLLEAVASEDWPKHCPLVVIGDGVEKVKVKKFEEKYPEKIIYLGKLPYNEMPPLIAKSIASFVCTQNLKNRAYSGMAPLKLFESMASGVPVIATKMPFQKDIIANSNSGILIDRDSPILIIKALQYLLDNPEEALKMGENGRNFIEAHHSWAVRAKDTNEVLKEISL